MEQRHVRHVLIIANWSKERSHSLSETIVEYLASKGIESTISRTNRGNEPLIVEANTDLVICLGGDGTVITSYSIHYTKLYDDLSTAGHEKSCRKQGGPPSKAKYSAATDSA